VDTPAKAKITVGALKKIVNLIECGYIDRTGLSASVGKESAVNEQFYELSEEKQQRIINAGFEVFGDNEYKRASTELIAQKAGISKGLLFYYFHNKKSLFIYLFDYAEELVKEIVMDDHFIKIRDFFELFEYAAEKKCTLMEKNPYIYDYMLRAFYSKGEDISEYIDNKTAGATEEMFFKYFAALDLSKFKPDVDPKDIINMLTWTTDGYMHDRQRASLPITVDDLMYKFRQWSAMLKKIAYKEEYQL
jgi:TetR/AcrR family transcriptional regulator